VTTLITGGTGLVGASLAEKLVQRGEHVVLLDLAPAEWRIRHVAETAGARLTVARGDVTSLVDLLDAIRTHRGPRSHPAGRDPRGARRNG
jgi:nucleoside-diphosphate-sugar epimerase